MDRRLTSGYVVFDLEANADRSDPPAHEIIEIGAVATERGQEVGTFTTLVRPTRRLRDFTRELTGLGDADLVTAPEPAEALAAFYLFVDGRPLVAHNGFGYDFRLLDAAGERTGVRPPEVTRLDSLELAHLVFPRAGRGVTANIDGSRPPQGRSLDDLVRHFWGDEPRDHHRALDDARLLHQVLGPLLAALDADEPARRLQRWVLATTRHPWADFLRSHDGPIPLEDVVPLPDPPQRAAPTGIFTPEAVGDMFADGGALMGRARKPRRQQVEMATDIADALLRGGHPRLIEAPTGTGKTLAYLAPSIEFARAHGETVIVAPHSKVLQDQVMATLEELQGELDPFNAVLVKGASNYIDLDALAGELDALAAEAGEGDEPASDEPEAGGATSGGTRRLEPAAGDAEGHTRQRNDVEASDGLIGAMICGWVAQTPTGDWDDLRSGAIERIARPLEEPRPGRDTGGSGVAPVRSNRTALRELRLRLACAGSRGPAQSALDRRDFVRRARDGLRTAHVGILNHALLVTWDEWLDRAKRLVLDEAHNLEDAATDALSQESAREDLLALADAVWDPTARRSTVHRLAAAARWSLSAQPLQTLRDATDDLRAACGAFGETVVEYVRTRTGARRSDQYGASYRIRPGIDTRHPDYGEVIRTGRDVVHRLRSVADVLNGVNLPQDLSAPYRRDRLEAEIRRLGRRSRDLAEIIDKVVWVEDPERWVAIGEIEHGPDGWRWSLRRSPVSVAHRLRSIWESLECAVLTSATLRVGRDFGHIIDTLGLDVVESPKLISSPFPGENHLLLLTDYLPAPRARLMEEFTASAAREIPRLLILTGGRGLGLMTARTRLQFVRDHARPFVENHGIPLLAQGDDSAPALVDRMRAERATSLLALRSFWEGVDVPGEALSMLIIEKIPFDSPADPVVGARMEAMELRGKDPFADYVVPRAALRFAQGVGRLIRTEQDRGVTVVLDNRLCRAVPYRDRILGTLPGPPRRERVIRADQAYQLIAGHLGDVTYDDEMRGRLEAVASADPWAEVARMELTEGDLTDTAEISERLDRVRERFEFDDWRPGQLETMRRFIRGDDTLAVLPTGSGKSITFQIPALLSPGLTLVISPLTALMNDQVENLRTRGVTTVAAIHSGVPQGEWRAVLQGAARGDYKLLYISPERLWSQEFVETLAQIGVARVAVDEAHCISQWGHSFRPEYTAIPRALARMGANRPPTLAVTATATPKVRNEIRRLLELRSEDGEPVALSPDRPEIRYYVEPCADHEDRDLRVVQVVEAFRSRAAIVYVPTRRDTTRIAGLLGAAGHSARPYHGGMAQPARQHVEDAFRHGDVDVVVATKAFGMGIDKPDIALIVHLEMPATIEEYVQETGRAARGAIGTGRSAGTAMLLRTPRDCSIHRLVIGNTAPETARVQAVWSRIEVGTHAYDPDQLAGGVDDADREGVDVALAVHYLQTDGDSPRADAGLRRHLNTPWRGRVAIMDDTGALIERLAATDPPLAERARGIVRLVEGSGSDEYRAEKWSETLQRPPDAIAADLLELNRQDIIGFTAWRHAWVLERQSGHEPDWAAIEETAGRRRAIVAEQSRLAKGFAEMWSLREFSAQTGPGRSRPGREFVAGGPRCRRRALLAYLGWDDDTGRDNPERCGRCDGCTDLDRPWEGSRLTREALVAALPVRRIVLQLVADTSRDRTRYSRRNLVRTLLGTDSSQHGLPARLAAHPTFGRLRLLGEDGAEKIIGNLIDEGRVAEADAEYEPGTSYDTLRITDEGLRFLGQR